jgi:hypothetical protein
MKLFNVLITITVLIFAIGCPTDPSIELTIDIVAKTRDSVTLEFNQAYDSITNPNEIEFEAQVAYIDIFLEDDTMESEWIIGHYEYNEISTRRLSMTIPSEFDATAQYTVKIYTGNFIDPEVIAETEPFFFSD